jgi:alpha-tubulin suppressor-like RCC1 family protein
VVLTSRTCVGKCLLLDANGTVFCTGNPQYVDNTPTQFEIVGSTYSNTAIRFRSMAYPQRYLAIVNGYFVGNVSFVVAS